MPDGRMLERPLLSGRLVASGGRLLLEIPASLVHGLFGLVRDPGVERPEGKSSIMVMTADEVKKLGGEDKITERGKTYGFTLGAVRTFTPGPQHPAASKLWAILCTSPELEALRAAYGLPARIHEHPFHIIFATRKRGVLQEGPAVVKSSHYLRSVLEKAAYIDFEEDNRKRPEGKESWIKRNKKTLRRAAGLGLAGAGIAGLYALGRKNAPGSETSTRAMPSPEPQPHQPPAGTPRVVSEAMDAPAARKGSDFLIPTLTGSAITGGLNTGSVALTRLRDLLGGVRGAGADVLKAFPAGVTSGLIGIPGAAAAMKAQQRWLDPLTLTGNRNLDYDINTRTLPSKLLLSAPAGWKLSTQIASRLPGVAKIPVAGKAIEALKRPLKLTSDPLPSGGRVRQLSMRSPVAAAGYYAVGGAQSLARKMDETGLSEALKDQGLSGGLWEGVKNPSKLWRAAVAAEGTPWAEGYYNRMGKETQDRVDGSYLRRALTYAAAPSTVFDDIGTLVHQAGENHAFNAGNKVDLRSAQLGTDRRFFDQYAKGILPREKFEEVGRLSPRFRAAIDAKLISPDTLKTKLELSQGMKGVVDSRLPSDIMRAAEGVQKARPTTSFRLPYAMGY